MSRFETFQWARRFRLLNLILQAILVLSLFSGLNYVARAFSWRFDLTRSRFYSLSAETRSYLEKLEAPVTAVVTFPEQSADEKLDRAYRDVRALLQEYAYAAENNPEARIKVEFVDVYRERAKAEELGLDEAYMVQFMAGNRRKPLFLDDLYEQRDGQIQFFVGERAFTSAILEVSNPRKEKIYFLSGHGEMHPSDVGPMRGLSELRDFLDQRNFELDSLNLMQAETIPSDASLLVIASPQTPFRPQEEEILRRYLSDRAGRLVALLDPALPHGLDRLLADWGMTADDVKVIEVNLHNLTEGGDLYVTHFLAHPITQYLIDNKLAMTVGANPRAIRPAQGEARVTGLTVTPLIWTSLDAWGERSYRVPGASRFDADIDLPGPVSLAVASERASAQDLPFSVRGGRLVVFGSSEFITNNRLTSLGNMVAFLDTIKWTLGQEIPLNIPPRSIERFQLSLSREELGQLYWVLLLALPGAAGLMGLLVYFGRRS